MVALKIKLFLVGKKKSKSFRLVVSPCPNRGGGRVNVVLGGFSDRGNTDKLKGAVNVEKLKYWLDQGAVPTEKAGHIIDRVLNTSSNDK